MYKSIRQADIPFTSLDGDVSVYLPLGACRAISFNEIYGETLVDRGIFITASRLAKKLLELTTFH